MSRGNGGIENLTTKKELERWVLELLRRPDLRITAAAPAATTPGHTIQDEGSSLSQRARLNFIGGGVTVTDDPSNNQTDVSIPAPPVETDAIALAALASHEADTTGIHGITNTANLLETSDIGSTVQAHDSDLAAIAALATTSFGRGLLTLADQAALLSAAGAAAASHTHAQSDITNLVTDLAAKQPLDSDLTAIAALSTTAFGRALLELADAAAARTAIDVDEAGTAASEVATHASDTSSVHGIADTTVLATDSEVASAVSDHNADTTVHGIDTANVPSSDEKAALPGTYGSPGSANRYVTDTDPRIAAETPPLSDAILALGPSLYWTLDDVTGITDQSGNGNDGTAQGGVTIGGGASLTSDGGTSTDFDGANDYISTSYSPFIEDSKRTFLGFAVRDASSSDDAVFGSDAASSWVQMNLPFGQQSVGFLPNSSGGAIYSVTGGWPGNATPVAWALIYDDATGDSELFINGVSKGSGSASAYSSPGTFQVGAAGASALLPFDGKMAHVAVFEKALSSASIAWLHGIGLGETGIPGIADAKGDLLVAPEANSLDNLSVGADYSRLEADSAEPLGLKWGPKDYGLVTALPTSPTPAVGDRCTYKADNTNGVFWELIYDGAGSYPWKKVGGPPLVTEGAWPATSTTTYSGSGPTLTVPLAGDYDVELDALGTLSSQVSAGMQALASYSIGATTASDADAGQFIAQADNVGLIVGSGRAHRTRRKTGLAAGAVLQQRSRMSAGAGTTLLTWVGPYFAIDPVRVG